MHEHEHAHALQGHHVEEPHEVGGAESVPHEHGFAHGAVPPVAADSQVVAPTASERAFGAGGGGGGQAAGQGARLTHEIHVRIHGQKVTLPEGTFVELVSEAGGSAQCHVFSGHGGAIATLPRAALHIEPQLIESGEDKIGGAGYMQYEGALWHGKPHPHDVYQGNCGDCWLLSSVAELAQTDPELITRVFSPHAPMRKQYHVTLHQKVGDGFKPVTLTVDTDFASTGSLAHDKGTPIYDGEGAPKMSNVNHMLPLWPMLLEKAIAQLTKGGFQTLDKGGWPSWAWEAVTGRHANEDYNTNQNALDRLKSLHGSGDAVCCGTRSDDAAKAAQKKYNFVDSHEYFLIAIKGDTLVFGNPWGMDEPSHLPASEFWNVFDEIGSVDASKSQDKAGASGGGGTSHEAGGIA